MRSSEDSDIGARYRTGKRDFLGIGLSCLSDETLVEAVRQAVETRSRLTISFINSDYVVHSRKTPGLLEKMNRFDIMLPDGWTVVLGGRLLGLPVANRQSNDEICPQIFSLSAQRGFSNFLFGSAEGTAEQAAANLRETFPGIPVAGCLHGYWDVVRGHPGRYDEADMDMMVQAINEAKPDILHVCIPTPGQQTWVWQVADRLDVPVIITGGSYLDHLAERIQWYPDWALKLPLAWAYRLSREPGRLWKRYSLGYLAYGRMLIKAKLSRRR